MSKTVPLHYTGSVIQPIQVVEDWGLDFCKGNAVKYIQRAGNKPGESERDDLLKAIWYLQRRIEYVSRMETSARLDAEKEKHEKSFSAKVI